MLGYIPQGVKVIDSISSVNQLTLKWGGGGISFNYPGELNVIKKSLKME